VGRELCVCTVWLSEHIPTLSKGRWWKCKSPNFYILTSTEKEIHSCLSDRSTRFFYCCWWTAVAGFGRCMAAPFCNEYRTDIGWNWYIQITVSYAWFSCSLSEKCCDLHWFRLLLFRIHQCISSDTDMSRFSILSARFSWNSVGFMCATVLGFSQENWTSLAVRVFRLSHGGRKYF